MHTSSHRRSPALVAVVASALLWVLAGCADDGDAPDASDDGASLGDSVRGQDVEPGPPSGVCELDTDAKTPPYLNRLGCADDFARLASLPLDASIPGARSVKTVVDTFDPCCPADAPPVYFQDSVTYQVHWEFCHAHLSGGELPPVAALSQFNQTEYYSPARRFLLGAVTHYEEPDLWAYEIAPYDTATADQMALAFRRVKSGLGFDVDLRLHPTSDAVAVEADNLPADVPTVSTGELFAGITFQPLNLGTSYGRLVFADAEALAADTLGFRDIAVLDHVPNDIGVVSGLVTSALQTPLSHVNVLSQNRGTPNMALIGAFTDQELRALEGRWVKLEVGAFEWAIAETTQAEADAWWEAKKDDFAVTQVPSLDESVTELTDAEELLDWGDEGTPTADALPSGPVLAEALDQAIPAFGGKASHYALLSHLGPTVNAPDAFAVPVAHYRAHMVTHGLDAQLQALLDDAEALADPTTRDWRLKALRKAIRQAPVDPELVAAIEAKMLADNPGVRMRMRSSTNAEDLDGFTGAGLYTSVSANPLDPDAPVDDAVREVWASLWSLRAFDERALRSIPQDGVGMALLVHPAFPDEEANGVALTANIFDTTGLEPGFYVNVQKGGESVVKPEPGTTTDSLIYYFFAPGQPTVYLSHSNLVPAGTTVLTSAQLYELGQGLDLVHRAYAGAYGPKPGEPPRFYAMDVEFKFDGPPGADPSEAPLSIKQARPHPGWGLGR